MAAAKNRIGFKQGKIEVIREAARNLKNQRMWEYRCLCGSIKSVDSSTIARTLSCGCLKAERIGNLNRKGEGESARNRLIAVYKNGAKRRNIKFELTDDQFFDFINLNCYYCGTPPTNTTNALNPNGCSQIVWNGIDRVNSKLGYHMSNCVTCCRHCNLAKHCFTQEEFMAWIERLVKYRCL